MAQVFISYSREDKAFVQRLSAALQATQREVWVDLKDIPPTAEWLREIYSGIEGADAFLFVVSPSSLTSQVCKEELTHAVEYKKRIVPIVCREVDGAQVPAPVAAINWIQFRAANDFAASFDQLTTALDTDLGYWHLASQLLARARQWENAAHN